MEGIYAYADQIKVYKAILDAAQEVQKYLRYHSGKSIKKLWSFWHAKKVDEDKNPLDRTFFQGRF